MVVRDDVGAAPAGDHRDLRAARRTGAGRSRSGRGGCRRRRGSTGRRAEASSSMTARDVVVGGPQRRHAARLDRRVARASSRRGGPPGNDRSTGPGRPSRAWRSASLMIAGDVRGRARLGGPLGEPADRGDLVDLLERLAAHGRRARPGRRWRTSGSSPAWPCGCRWRGSTRRRRACRGRRPAGRSAGRGPRP